jgi:hypothetical protein
MPKNVFTGTISPAEFAAAVEEGQAETGVPPEVAEVEQGVGEEGDKRGDGGAQGPDQGVQRGSQETGAPDAGAVPAVLEPGTPGDAPSGLPESETSGVDVPDTSQGAPPEAPEAGETAPVETDWKKRYDDIRTAQNRALEAERAQRQAEREQSERLIAELLARQGTPAALTEEQVQAFTRQAEELGLDASQAAWFVNVARDFANAQSEATRREMLTAQQQIAQRSSAAGQEAANAAQNEAVKQAFLAEHPITEAIDNTMFEVLLEIGATEQFDAGPGRQPITVPAADAEGNRILYPEALEVAYEAAQNPALRDVLRALPALYESDEGLAMARRLAGTVAPAPSSAAPPAPAVAEAVAAVDAARTLGAGRGGGPAPTPSKDDPITELEAFAESRRGNVFTG